MNLKNPGLEKWIDTLLELRKPLLLIVVLWGSSLFLILLSSVAKAEARCNCAEVIDNCSATVNLNNMQVAIVSDSEACARVDYLIDGQPFAALLVGGSAEFNWSGQPLLNPLVIVENCRVCADASEPAVAGNAKAADASTTGEARADSGAKSIVKVMPDYPREAWTNRIEGHVILEFNINAVGKVENIRLLESTDPVFITDSMDALSRFRYTPALKDGQAVSVKKQREQFRFRIPDGANPLVSSNEA